MVLYSRGVWNALFSLAVYKKTDVYKNGRSPVFIYFFLCFGKGTSVARRDHGGGLALSESSRGYCPSWYDAEITRNRQWRQRITEDLPDAYKMYDWNIYIYIYINVYIYIYILIVWLVEKCRNDWNWKILCMHISLDSLLTDIQLGYKNQTTIHNSTHIALLWIHINHIQIRIRLTIWINRNQQILHTTK